MKKFFLLMALLIIALPLVAASYPIPNLDRYPVMKHRLTVEEVTAMQLHPERLHADTDFLQYDQKLRNFVTSRVLAGTIVLADDSGKPLYVESCGNRLAPVTQTMYRTIYVPVQEVPSERLDMERYGGHELKNVSVNNHISNSVANVLSPWRDGREITFDEFWDKVLVLLLVTGGVLIIAVLIVMLRNLRRNRSYYCPDCGRNRPFPFHHI